MDQSSDVLLTTGPFYQATTFGDKYVSSSSPTLVNAGSRSPAAAGLYHFTTLPNQTKDANQAKVNIGLHYVAAVSGKAADFDNDGIPDYVENWHGDGNYSAHTDAETDWQNQQTIAGTPDASNVIYDGTDLDGDGLTGSIERFLGTDPLVPSNVLQLPAIQNASGFLDIPLGVSIPANSWSALRLYVNGEEASVGEVVQASDGTWHAQLDTFGLASRPCLLQLAISFAADPDSWQTAFGRLSLVGVGNIVTVNPPTRLFTDSLHIDAVANIPAANYRVEIRDAGGTLLKTLTGSVQAGAISDSWDLKDGNGNVIVSGPVQATFFLDTGGTPLVSAPAIFQLLKSITGQAFAIAYAGYRFPRSDLLLSDNVVDALCAGEGFDPGDYDLLPNNYNVPYADNPFEWTIGTTSENTSTLTDALANQNCANFYWQGHGGPNIISPISDTHTTYVNDGLTPGDVARLLGNRGQAGNAFFNNHPYRLVILDACNTWAIAWANVFGIPLFGEETKAVFTQYGLDPCAFVGWREKTSQYPTADARNAYGRCLNELFGNWYTGQTLKQCLTAYNTALKDPLNSPYLFSFDSWKIAGCSDLTSRDR